MTTDGEPERLRDVTYPVSTSGLFDRPLRDTLLDLADQIDPDERPDRYGKGAVIEDLEQRLAALLGKPAAVFAPSGTMLQQIALRIWADRTGRRTVGMHPQSHLERHEFRAHEVLHGLRGVPLGSPDQPLSRAVLEDNHEPLGSLLLELPQRWLGYVLPTWGELNAMVAWARQHGAMLHLDGARLLESAPHYADEVGPVPGSLAGIAELFDTVYVSLYKIVGGIAGAALAGPVDAVDEARVWVRRHGGELVHQWPMAVSSRVGLERVLPRVSAYHERAVRIAQALAGVEDIEVHPAPPHTNAFRVYVHGDAATWQAAHDELAGETGIGLTRQLFPTIVPSVSVFEVVVSEASFAVEVDEVAAMFRAVAERR